MLFDSAKGLKPLVIFLIYLAAPASAETLGRMTAFLDGVPLDWHLITFVKGGEVTASASFRQTPYKAELILHGHAKERFASKGGLSVEARFGGVFEVGAEPIGLDILYLPEGLRGPIWTSNDATTAPRIEIIAFDVWGDVGHVEAVFQGELCLRQFIYSPTDTSQCKSLSGQVTTDLAVE